MNPIKKAKLKRIAMDASAMLIGASAVLVPVAITVLYYKRKYEGCDVLIGLNEEDIEHMLKHRSGGFISGKTVDFVVAAIPKD